MSLTPRRLLAFAVVATLMMPGAALAKKKKKDKDPDAIWRVGIESIDDFFKDVDKIDRSVDRANRQLDVARTDLNAALGLNKRTTLPKALAELDVRADGKVKLVMNGKIPKLEAADAVPTDVASGVDAVNGFTKKMVSSIDNLYDASSRTAALVRESRALPERARAELQDDGILVSLFRAPKAIKAVNHNVGLTRQLPGKTEKTVSRLHRINRSIVTEFGDGQQVVPGLKKGRTGKGGKTGKKGRRGSRG